MECRDLIQCYAEIDAYLHGAPTGYPMLINTENLDTHRTIMARLESNPEIQCIRVSDASNGDRLPDIDLLLDSVSESGSRALFGLSQYMMLRSADDLELYIKQALNLSIGGHLVVLLYHCGFLLHNWEKKDIRLKKRIVYMTDIHSGLPRLSIVESGHPTTEGGCEGIQGLLEKLETMSEQELDQRPEICVRTRYSTRVFGQSLYTVGDGNDIFAVVIRQYPELTGCERTYGSNNQWLYLYNALQGLSSFGELIGQQIGALANLQSIVSEVFRTGNENKKWLLWLALRVFGVKDNAYLSKVVRHSQSVDDFERCIVMTLLDIPVTDSCFLELYDLRKCLVKSMPENLPLISQYCQRIARFEKNAVFYLTDLTAEEKHEFMRCLSIYEYEEEELLLVTSTGFPEIHKYLQMFKFTPANMQVPEQNSELREMFTQYFHAYKQQKVTNRIWPSFMQQVVRYAEERPYNMLQARSTLAARMDKQGTQLFFFDALGVEYLAYIRAKCEQYGLLADISVGVCQLPSITEENKDFIQFFSGVCKKIDALDELKHHSQIYDYQQCKEPIHLFRELEIIDEQVRLIHSQLVRGVFDKAVIISDHGASRLAVINNRQSASTIQLDEKGEHSGRCCPTETDPGIASATYTPSGYAVLANYDRFKGGRLANVEVHGGATLEEVLVPLITITPRPSAIEIDFVEKLIQPKGREPIAVTVFANVTFSDPILVVEVNGKERTYHGEFVADHKHARFTMEDIKRSKDYTADFYDGAKRLATGLVFTIQKATKENNLLGI